MIEFSNENQVSIVYKLPEFSLTQSYGYYFLMFLVFSSIADHETNCKNHRQLIKFKVF